MRPHRATTCLGAALLLTVGVAAADAARLAHDGLRAYDGGDSAEAAELWREAANQGSTYGMVALGGLLEEGDGVPRNLTAARRWYASAARAGDPHAMLLLSEFVPNPAQSAEWLARAAALGHARAIQILQTNPPMIRAQTPKKRETQ